MIEILEKILHDDLAIAFHQDHFRTTTHNPVGLSAPSLIEERP